MFVVNGSDYTIVVVVLAVGFALFGLQYLLYHKTTHLAPKLIPAIFVALTFLLSLFCLFDRSGTGGFLDITSFIAAVIAGIGGTWALFVGAAWLLCKLKNKKTP